MSDLSQALKAVRKALAPQPQKPKLTPKQFIQKQKISARVQQVLKNQRPLSTLIKPVLKFNQSRLKSITDEIQKNLQQKPKK
ncbi:hypothetical protein [Celerinatantimonas sp. YJH-8]|uniref:hypothetical protein n=1 Tax=Celerinatantimonas sp. YJH-8 TaxID=3228714 RepID=UPI0038C076D2